MTYLLALGHCSRSIGFPSISPPLDTIGLRATFGLGSMELWTSINMSLANTTHRRLREHRREQNTDPQHLTMTLENILCCPHLVTLNKLQKKNLINEMMRTSQLLVESALGQSVSPLSPLLGPVITRIRSGWAPRSYGPPNNMGFHDFPLIFGDDG